MFDSSSPKVSLIISVYKNVDFLDAVLRSVKKQSFRDFEVIISEDGESSEMKDYVSHLKTDFSLLHLTQPDVGWRKNRALNRAVQVAKADWLVFIDGDCVLHSRFLEFHWQLAEEKAILAGKRVKLDASTSEKLISGEYSLEMMSKIIRRNAARIKKNGGGFLEEGVFIDPRGWLGFIPRLRKMSQLKGCNMSFHRKAIEAINGFDEDYIRPAVGEDIDLLWRFEGKGYYLKSLRNLAVQFHLWHKESWTDQAENMEMMRENQSNRQFVCKNGLKKLN
jgi:glycosyltransferase involved in cell wall biosynthesis